MRCWGWVQQVVEERGKQGLYAGVLLCLTSLSGLFSGFCMGFFFADLVWLNRHVYIFSAEFCKWKKTNKQIENKTPGANSLLYLWEINSSFLILSLPFD